MGKDAEETYELPQTSVVRIVKAALPESASMSAEVKKAFSKAAGIFVLYLTSTANDFCQAASRSTLNGDDVMAAIEELELDPKSILEPMKQFRIAFQAEAEKKKKAAAATKAAAAAGGADGKTKSTPKKKKPDTSDADSGADGDTPKKKKAKSTPPPASSSAAAATASVPAETSPAAAPAAAPADPVSPAPVVAAAADTAAPK